MKKFVTGTIVGTTLGMWVFASMLVYRTVHDGLDVTALISDSWKRAFGDNDQLKVNSFRRKYTRRRI